MSKTKIIATIGPACDSLPMVEAMVQAGVNCFRFNLKHGAQEWHGERIMRVNQVAQEVGKPVGVLLDLQGPEIRAGVFEEGELEVIPGEKISFATKRVRGEKTIVLDNLKLLKSLKKGTIVVIDDGMFKFEVTRQAEGKVTAKVIKGGMLGSRKGVNVLNVEVELPTLVEKDLEHLSMAARHNVDFVALSFVRRKEDVKLLRKEMDKRGVEAKIIAKIENQQALDNFDEILAEADGIMIARGDLGVEVELYKLPILQKQMIRKTRAVGKPIITATQMLQSMVTNSLPTRAEVSDVANAVLDRTDAIMLSGETAQGQYPLEAVSMMAQIAEYTESQRLNLHSTFTTFNTAEDAVAEGAYHLYKGYEQTHPGMIKAFIVLTEYGLTARMLAKFRTNIPILAITDKEETRDKLTLSYGVEPYYLKSVHEGGRKSLAPVFNYLTKLGVLKAGDQVIAVKGERWTVEDQTNTISLETVT